MDSASEDMAVASGEVFDVELADLDRLVALLSLSFSPHGP